MSSNNQIRKKLEWKQSYFILIFIASVLIGALLKIELPKLIPYVKTLLYVISIGYFFFLFTPLKFNKEK